MVVELAIDKMAAGGDGIGRLADGRVAFVGGAWPGERVAAEVHADKRDYVKATLTEVLDASPHRRMPPCPMLAKGCGGCAWQHAAADAQLRWKGDVVVDALARTARLRDAEVLIGGAVPEWQYRTTMRLASDRSGHLGLRAAASHQVIALDQCPVAHPLLSELIPVVEVRGAKEVQLRVSAHSGERTALILGGARARIEAPRDVRIGRRATVTERVAGCDLRVSAASFFQSGPVAAELLVGVVREAVGDLAGEALLDAYGGVGLFAATVAHGSVTVVESSSSATADARHNLPGAEVVTSEVEQWAPRPFPVVVADPARAGLGTAGAAVIAAATARRLVLVSCDPVAMARDVALLRGHGLEHRRSVVLDLFPNTPHVEVVTVLDR